MATKSAKKNLVLSIQEDAAWVSVNKITKNLLLAYRELDRGDIDFMTFSARDYNQDKKFGTGYIQTLTKQILERKYTRIIIIDSQEAILELLACMLSIWPNKSKPDCTFHIFGDFTLRSDIFLNLENILEGSSVQFICASHRQKELVHSYLIGPKSNIEVIHFPVNENEYTFNFKLRAQARGELNIEDHDKVFIYAGRISQQKNIIWTLEAFLIFANKNSNATLLIAGEFDDIGSQMLGMPTALGFSFSKVQKFLLSVPTHIKNRIRFLGDCSSAELFKLYHAADAFISLSTYHDEDYGMAPAEAMSLGLPCVLTDWGGYSSFSVGNENCHLITVELGARGFEVDFAAVARAMKLASSLSADKRVQFGQRFAERFGIQSASAKCNNILNSKLPTFIGFTPLFSRLNNKVDYPLVVQRDAPYESYYGPYFKPIKLNQDEINDKRNIQLVSRKHPVPASNSNEY